MYLTILFAVLVAAAFADTQQNLCTRARDCDQCLQDPDCGWCAFNTGLGRCVTGNEWGPKLGSCNSWNRTWLYYSCSSEPAPAPWYPPNPQPWYPPNPEPSPAPWYPPSPEPSPAPWDPPSPEPAPAPWYPPSPEPSPPGTYYIHPVTNSNWYSNCTGNYIPCGNSISLNFSDPSGKDYPPSHIRLWFTVIQKDYNTCVGYYGKQVRQFPEQIVYLNSDKMQTGMFNSWNCETYCNKQVYTTTFSPENYQYIGFYQSNDVRMDASFFGPEFCVYELIGELVW